MPHFLEICDNRAHEAHMLNDRSFFPLRILLLETNKIVVVNSPSDIPSGESFRVLETCVRSELA